MTQTAKKEKTRRNSFKQKTAKKPLTVVVLILVLCFCVAGVVTTALSQRAAVPTVREALVYVGYLLVLAASYLLRYRDHRAAGLLDKGREPQP